MRMKAVGSFVKITTQKITDENDKRKKQRKDPEFKRREQLRNTQLRAASRARKKIDKMKGMKAVGSWVKITDENVKRKSKEKMVKKRKDPEFKIPDADDAFQILIDR
jgi:heterodisulfide reductase subunit C